MLPIYSHRLIKGNWICGTRLTWLRIQCIKASMHINNHIMWFTQLWFEQSLSNLMLWNTRKFSPSLASFKWSIARQKWRYMDYTLRRYSRNGFNQMKASLKFIQNHRSIMHQICTPSIHIIYWLCYTWTWWCDVSQSKACHLDLFLRTYAIIYIYMHIYIYIYIDAYFECHIHYTYFASACDMKRCDEKYI